MILNVVHLYFCMFSLNFNKMEKLFNIFILCTTLVIIQTALSLLSFDIDI